MTHWRPHCRSLHNRPLWLYLWNSITLTQTDGLAFSGDARHLLASADMSALRNWWNWSCVSGNKRRKGKKEKDKKIEERKKSGNWGLQAGHHTVALKSLQSFKGKHVHLHSIQGRDEKKFVIIRNPEWGCVQFSPALSWKPGESASVGL